MAALHTKVVIAMLAGVSWMGLAQDAQSIPGTSYWRHSDVVYGRKHGVALTMDVFVPPKPNGAVVIRPDTTTPISVTPALMRMSGFTGRMADGWPFSFRPPAR
jgi:hypothetical protein